MKCLVVDDESWSRKVISKLIRSLGGTVIEAQSATEGVEKAASHLPDVILLDVNMPTRTGIQALSDIREAAPNAQVIILTAEYRERDESVVQLPRVSYVEKNFWDLPTLARIISRAYRATFLRRRQEVVH